MKRSQQNLSQKCHGFVDGTNGACAKPRMKNAAKESRPATTMKSDGNANQFQYDKFVARKTTAPTDIINKARQNSVFTRSRVKQSNVIPLIVGDRQRRQHCGEIMVPLKLHPFFSTRRERQMTPVGPFMYRSANALLSIV